MGLDWRASAAPGGGWIDQFTPSVMVTLGLTPHAAFAYRSMDCQVTRVLVGVEAGNGSSCEARVAMTPPESTIPRAPAKRSFHMVTAADCRQLAVTPALQVLGREDDGMLTPLRAFRLYTN